MSPPKDDTLDWLAFCYLAGEMSISERDQFEARLADDQAAREALARAVELSQLVAAAESQRGPHVVPATRGKAGWTTRLAWMAIGGLAAAAVGLFTSGVLGPVREAVVQKEVSKRQMALASAWTEARAHYAHVREAGLWPVAMHHIAEGDEELLAASEASGDDNLVDAPSWMTSAVFSLAGRSLDDAEPFANERLEN